MVFNENPERIEPMVADNMVTESWSDVTFFDALKKLFQIINELIRQAINEKVNTPEAQQ
ncbi:MAG: hypothetical protein IJ261_05185 [Clostridia bacterium]|nr:hypothetical protein [Clostridia bacterium]